MVHPWSNMTAWSVLAERWQEEMTSFGQPVERLTATVDVVCSNTHELKLASIIEGLWISSSVFTRRLTLTAEDLFTRQKQGPNSLPDTRELARSLAKAAGHPELIAAVLIAATASGYADGFDSLQMAGSLARARLNAAGVPIPRQTIRSTFLTEDRFDLAGVNAQALPRALAIEHSALLKGKVAVRIRPLLQTATGTRIPAMEELRMGLTNAMMFAGTTDIAPVVSEAAKRSEAAPSRRVALSSLPLDEQHTIIDAIAGGLAGQGVNIDSLTSDMAERRSSSLFGPLMQVSVLPSEQAGWRLRFSRLTLMTVALEDADATAVSISPDGDVNDEEMAALAGLVKRTVDMAGRIDAQNMRIDAWERIDPRDLRVDPLRRKLIGLSGIDLNEDVQWRIGDGAPEPVSLFPVHGLGIRVTENRVHLLKTWLPCPRDGGILVEDDGHTQRITTPRLVPNTKLDQPIGVVLGQPALADIDDVMIDAIAKNAEDASVLYLRSRPTSLPFPDEFRERR